MRGVRFGCPMPAGRGVDPTNVVAPERVNLGFESFLERSAGAGEISSGFTRTFARQPLLCHGSA